MFSASLPVIGIIIIFTISVALVLVVDYRMSIIMLGILYIGSYLLLAWTLPDQLAIIKLIAGGIACSVLWLTARIRTEHISKLDQEKDSTKKSRKINKYLGGSQSGTVFQFFTGVLFLISIYFLTPIVLTWLPSLPYTATFGGMVILGMGLLKLGFSEDPLIYTMGLLMFILGFDMIYVNLEGSLLVAGLLAMVTLGVAVIGAYLITIPELGDST